MIRFIKKDVLVVSLLLLLASMSNQIIGQEAFTFQGPYEIKPYKGMATFDYILKEKDTIFNGKFILQRSNLNALLKEEDSSFMFQGNFISNIATGPWIFQFGKYQSKQNTEVVDLQYNVRISGTQKQAKGTLVNGKPDGKWEIEVNQIEESKIVNTLFNSRILFKKGWSSRKYTAYKYP